MKAKRPIIYKVPPPVMSDADFRMMLEGVMFHRNNLINHGTPYSNQPSSEVVEQRKNELTKQIAECREKIKELEEVKDQYNALLRVIYEEDERIRTEQRRKAGAQPR